MAKKTNKYSDPLAVAQKFFKNGARKSYVSLAEWQLLQAAYDSDEEFRNWFDSQSEINNVTVTPNVNGGFAVSSTKSKSPTKTVSGGTYTKAPITDDAVKNANRGRKGNVGGITRKPGYDEEAQLSSLGALSPQIKGVNNVQFKYRQVYNKKTGQFEDTDEIIGASYNGGRMRTQEELNYILNRGMRGNKMSNREHQAIYGAWQREQARRDNKAKQDENAAKAQDQYAQARAEKLQLLGMKGDEKLSDLQIQDLLDQRAARLKTDEDLRKAKEMADYNAQIAAQQAETKRRQTLLDDAEKTRLSQLDNGRLEGMTDEDYSRWMAMGGNKGLANWDYSPEDQEEIKNRQMWIQEQLHNGNYNQEQAKMAEDQLNGLINSGFWKKQVQKKPNTPEGEPILSENGKFLWDGKKWEAYNPQAEKTTKEEALENERKKYLLKRLENSRKDWDSDNEYLGNGEKNPNYGKIFDAEDAQKKAMADWESVYGKSADAAAAAEPMADYGICPECGAPLSIDEQGMVYCEKCGWSAHGGAARPMNGEAPEAAPSQFEPSPLENKWTQYKN